MSYALATSLCFGCGLMFFYNPMRVPSVVVEGVREPICRWCVDKANVIRKARGMPEIVPLPDAYEACLASELME
jgi:hypothetical protein